MKDSVKTKIMEALPPNLRWGIMPQTLISAAYVAGF